MPGFSTKEAADDISGRGFGMDIVRDSIRKLSGDLQISSVEGQGTKMVVKLPLTLAILTRSLSKCATTYLPLH
jgi:two-component system chemotaxis sensor kinase CheA